METALRITVVTPCFNSKNTIRETIESVLLQNYKHLEHIVIDGGSTDGTLDIIREYPHLSCVSEKDEGHYDAMNKGVLRAKGDVIVVLNADDCFRKGAFDKVVAAFKKNPVWDGLFTDCMFVDSQKQPISPREEAKYDYDVLRFGFDYICHQTLFIKRQVYERLGGYRYKEFKNVCDYDFILRLGREQCRIGHIPEILLDYRYHEHGQSADIRIRNNMIRESKIIQREHGRPDGVLGKLFYVYAQARRQFQKLLIRGKLDIIPSPFRLKRHLRAKSTFSSNIGLDKL